MTTLDRKRCNVIIIHKDFYFQDNYVSIKRINPNIHFENQINNIVGPWSLNTFYSSIFSNLITVVLNSYR